MGYTVNKSLRFECDYDDILAYLVDDLKSPRSALALINEMDRVIDFLETTPFANSVSTKPTLAKNEYREMTVKCIEFKSRSCILSACFTKPNATSAS